MAWHARHVAAEAGGVRVQISFQRTDLLYAHDQPLRDPYAAARTEPVAVPRLPLATDEGYLVGPTILDMLVRRRRPLQSLPPETHEALVAKWPPDKALPDDVFTWSVREFDSLWPKPGDAQAAPSADRGDRTRRLDHPFYTALASGGVPLDTPSPEGWFRVRRRSTCLISEHAYRLAVGVYGSIGDAYTRVAETAAEAWEADQRRVLEIWNRVLAAPARVLYEDRAIEALRPRSSISQQVEITIMREVCRWLGVDPNLPVERGRGRPKAVEKASDQGRVIRVTLDGEGMRGTFISDYQGVPSGTALHELKLHTLVAVLGALRTEGLSRDEELLETWLDTAVPAWRERVADDNSAASSTPDPYEVLGIPPDATMDEVTAEFRKAMKAVHPDVSGGASTWLSRAVLGAYKQIRAARGGST